MVVFSVNVDVFELSPLAKDSAAGENPPELTPDGNEPTLRFAVKAPALVPRFTVTRYVTLPAVPYVTLPVCAPTVTEPICAATSVTVGSVSTEVIENVSVRGGDGGIGAVAL